VPIQFTMRLRALCAQFALSELPAPSHPGGPTSGGCAVAKSTGGPSC
jgi:hypothetical protein